MKNLRQLEFLWRQPNERQAYAQVPNQHSKGIREELRLIPGEELLVDVLGNTIRFRRPGSIKGLRGSAKGMKWQDEDRDHSERF